MKTRAAVIDDIFVKEGDHYHVSDQPTGRGGIILPTLSAFLGRPARLDELKALSHVEARAVVDWVLSNIEQRLSLDGVTFEPLKLQIVDFAYNSGDALALRWLQRILRVPRTGAMDAATRAALAKADPWLVHHAYGFARLQMIDMWSDPDPKRAKDINTQRKNLEEGVENRALSYSLLEIP